jgi:hypothetical protein
MKVSDLRRTQDAGNRWGQIRTQRRARKLRDALGSLKTATDELKKLAQGMDDREDADSLIGDLRSLVEKLKSCLFGVEEAEG